MNTKLKGNKAEGVILSEFIKNDIPALLPFGDNEKYDLVIELNKKFYSVQVKYGRYENGCVISDSRHRIGSNRNEYEKYYGKVDFIAIWCEKLNTSYIIESCNIDKTLITLRVEEPKNNSCITKIKWAKDYTFEKIINKYSK